MRINCHVPITLRITGVPTDDQLAAAGAALTRAVAARLAEAERLLAHRHGHDEVTGIQIREPYDPAREGAQGYAVPSREHGGDGSYTIPSYNRDGGPVKVRLHQRKAGKTTAPTASAPGPTQAVSHYEEIPLPNGRIRIHAWGRVGDPIARPGLEKKYPEPGKVGLAGYDRWHLAGPDATGAEEGIAYAPKNFNIGKTAEVENIVRRARNAVREQGGEVFFDFTADCRIVGEYEGVSIRVVEVAHWQVDVRAAGSDRIVPVHNERVVVPSAPPRSMPTASGPAAQGSASSPAAVVRQPPPAPTPAPEPTPQETRTPEPATAEGPAPVTGPANLSAPVPEAPAPEAPAPRVARPSIGHDNIEHDIGMAFAGGAFDMIDAIVQVYISQYLQEEYAAPIAEEARQEITKAIERARGDFKALITARRADIIAAQADGRKVILRIVVETNWQSTGIGAVLTRAEVGDYQLVFEDGPLPRPYSPPSPGGSPGEFFRDVAGVKLRFQTIDIELPGINENAARRRTAHRLIEAKMRTQMKSPPDFELLIIEALEMGLPLDDLREYTRYRAQLAAGSENPDPATESPACWEAMATLIDGPVERLIAVAKRKNLPLDGLLWKAKRLRDLAISSNPSEFAHWSDVVRLIEGR